MIGYSVLGGSRHVRKINKNILALPFCLPDTRGALKIYAWWQASSETRWAFARLDDDHHDGLNTEHHFEPSF